MLIYCFTIVRRYKVPTFTMKRVDKWSILLDITRESNQSELV